MDDGADAAEAEAAGTEDDFAVVGFDDAEDAEADEWPFSSTGFNGPDGGAASTAVAARALLAERAAASSPAAVWRWRA